MDGIMFSVTSEQDTDYRKAYEEGDTEKAEDMVREAAANRIDTLTFPSI